VGSDRGTARFPLPNSLSCDDTRVTIEQKRISGQLVLLLSGRVDADNAPVLEQECNARIAEGLTSLVVDVGGLTYVSSMGLRCFVAVAKTLQSRGGELRICRLQGLVDQVFEITGLKRTFPVYETLEAAVGGGAK
jgi:anti-anti-sigma factor